MQGAVISTDKIDPEFRIGDAVQATPPVLPLAAVDTNSAFAANDFAITGSDSWIESVRSAVCAAEHAPHRDAACAGCSPRAVRGCNRVTKAMVS
eukprot:SAG11_NODE_10896_length_798_cov_1.309013_1_plen_93_part_01